MNPLPLTSGTTGQYTEAPASAELRRAALRASIAVRRQELEDDLGAVVVCDLVRQFLDRIDDELQKIEGASGDAVRLAQTAHAFRSPAVMFGLDAVADLCRRIEQEARAGQGDLHPSTGRSLRQWTADGAHVLRDYLAEADANERADRAG